MRVFIWTPARTGPATRRAQTLAGVACAALVGLALHGPVHAQVQPAAPAAPTAAASGAGISKGEARALRDFRLLDANGDGELSRAEVRLFPRLAAAFDTADTDRSGSVSLEEVRTFAAQYRAERARENAARATGAGTAAPSPPKPRAQTQPQAQ